MKIFIINEYKKEFVNYKPVGKGSDIVQFFLKTYLNLIIKYLII